MAERPAALAPGSRSSLREVLAPPGDFELERALGTAYSLDAATLIAVPLFADGSDEDERTTPLGVQRIFELGKRLTLLVQGDRINVPPNVRPELLALVEDAVVACSQPRASFHPKLLVLEYVDHNTGTKQRRVVLSSRNLTVDSSWDFVVVLDEAKAGGTAIPGLGEAIRGLAGFVTYDETARAECHRVGDLLDSICFEPLPFLDNVGVRLFAPGGESADQVLASLTGEDLLVISPFVRESFLRKLAKQAGSRTRVLVTRPVDVDEAIFEAFTVHQLREDLTDNPAPRDADDVAPSADGGVDGRGWLRGLHAKMYFATDKNRTAVVLTSANASASGWGRNVEIALFGSAPSRKFAVSDLLRQSTLEEIEARDARRFGDLLVPLTKDATGEEPEDPLWLKEARTSLASATVLGVLGTGEDQPTLSATITLHPAASLWPSSLEATVEPYGYPQLAQSLARSGTAELSSTIVLPPGTKVTRFLTVRLQDGQQSYVIVLLMSLAGDREWSAEDAKAQLMREMKPQFLRDLAWKVGVPLPEPTDAHSAHEPGLPTKAVKAVNPPILERLLANLYSPKAAAYVETLDGLIGSVEDDPEFEQLVQVWTLLRKVAR